MNVLASSPQKNSPGPIAQKGPKGIDPKHTSTANQTGLPDGIKHNLENLSGYTMDDVRVHYNSSKPQQYRAHGLTHGTDIYLASNQEKHLAHEAWHVAQQKKGVVSAQHNTAFNNDRHLEQEADTKAAQLLSEPHTIKPYASSLINSSVSKRVVQRKPVNTDYGSFETETFEANSTKTGLEITLRFDPDPNKVNAKKIGLVQSVKSIDGYDRMYGVDPTATQRMVGVGKKGEGYILDQHSEYNNPIYSGSKEAGLLKKGKGLEDMPRYSGMDPELSKTNNHLLGHCYLPRPKSKKKRILPAKLKDGPNGSGTVGESKMFETTALALDGQDKGTYYGSVKWGFEMVKDGKKSKLKPYPISEASKGTPTDNFLEPAKLWNKSKTRGTLEVSTAPEAEVLEEDRKTKKKLAKGTRLIQVKPMIGSGVALIKVRIVKANGKPSEKPYYIMNTDVIDLGDGAETINLPIPQ